MTAKWWGPWVELPRDAPGFTCRCGRACLDLGDAHLDWGKPRLTVWSAKRRAYVTLALPHVCAHHAAKVEA